MLMSSSLGLTNLKQIAPDHAQHIQMMLALLDGEKADSQLPLAARLVESGHEVDRADWVFCGRDLFLHIAVADGRPQIFRENRMAEMVSALDAAEPILSEIEMRTGLILDPAEAVSSLPENSLIFEVSSTDQQHMIALALAPDFVASVTMQKMFDGLEIDWAQVPVAFEVQISGPSLGIEAAASIEPGDLILIGGTASSARIIWPADSVTETYQAQKIAGRYDMFSGQFIANGAGNTMEPSAANGASVSASAGFSVPISIRLPSRMASAAELSAMRPGTMLNIGAVTQGLSVSILVGDQEIAQGELVQVGNQFAVMIEQKVVHSEAQSGLSQASTDTE
jgi:flagellar motor switch/type III secretory pathway protein FliN